MRSRNSSDYLPIFNYRTVLIKYIRKQLSSHESYRFHCLAIVHEFSVRNDLVASVRQLCLQNLEPAHPTAIIASFPTRLVFKIRLEKKKKKARAINVKYLCQVNPTYLFVWSASVSVYNRAADAARVVDVHWSELLPHYDVKQVR